MIICIVSVLLNLNLTNILSVITCSVTIKHSLSCKVSIYHLSQTFCYRITLQRGFMLSCLDLFENFLQFVFTPGIQKYFVHFCSFQSENAIWTFQCQFIDSILTLKTEAFCHGRQVWEGNDEEEQTIKNRLSLCLLYFQQACFFFFFVFFSFPCRLPAIWSMTLTLDFSTKVRTLTQNDKRMCTHTCTHTPAHSQAQTSLPVRLLSTSLKLNHSKCTFHLHWALTRSLKLP